MILETLGILCGLLLLILGANRFVTGAANIARNLGVSPLIIGLTIVGIATSAPEILVGAAAAIDGRTEIAIGNAVGSNIANIGMVLGLSVLLVPAVISSRTLRREYMLMLLSAILAAALLADRELSRLDATILLLSLTACMVWIVHIARQSQASDPLLAEFEHELEKRTPLGKSILVLCVGLGLLLGGAELLINSAVLVAKHFGISDLVIGLTIIAVGTSLPELAASITCVFKKEADIAVGNVIGSNMFNALAVVGVPGLIHPAAFSSDVVTRDLPVMFGLTILMGWMVFISGKGRFGRIEGGILLLCFVVYQYSLFA